MTPEQLVMVRRTAALVERDDARFVRLFYGRLVDVHPKARMLFPIGPPVEGCPLVDAIVALAAAAVDLPVFLERAHELGMRQSCQGFSADDYPIIGDALVDAVGDIVGPTFTAEAATAWRRLYALMAETMLEGAAGALFSGPE